MGNSNFKPFWDTGYMNDKNYDIFRKQLVKYNEREKGKGDFWRSRIGILEAKKLAESRNDIWAFSINGRGDALFFTLFDTGKIPNGASLTYSPMYKTYILKNRKNKCVVEQRKGNSMVLTCNQTKKYFDEGKAIEARVRLANMREKTRQLHEYGAFVDFKLNKGYQQRTAAHKRLSALNKKLNDSLTEYNKYYDEIRERRGDDTTVNAMKEDQLLKDKSAEFYYYLWLVLAISGLTSAAAVTIYSKR
tara:strand:- start:821 stop:1561 length:741 start_codon:yes stop_codon:yes gene_type:complete